MQHVINAHVCWLQGLIAELQAGSPQKENQPNQDQTASPAATAAAAAEKGGKPSIGRAAMAPTRRKAFHGGAANRAAAMKEQIEACHLTNRASCCASVGVVAFE